MGSRYEKMGDVNDVENANPMTGDMWKMMMGNLEGLGGKLDSFDPSAAFASGLGQASDASAKMMEPYKKEMMNFMNAKIGSNIRGAESQFGGMANFSGAHDTSRYRGIAEPTAQGFAQMAGLGAQTTQNLLGQQLGMQGMGYQGDMQRYGQNLQGMQGYGSPEWWQPQIVERNTALGDYMDFVGTAAGAAVGAAI